MKRSRLILLALGIALTAPVLAGCPPIGTTTANTNCHGDFTSSGPVVKNNKVWDDLNVWCSYQPHQYSVVAEMDYHHFPNGPYTLLQQTGVLKQPPGEGGYVMTPQGPCLVGWYRAKATIIVRDTVNDIPATVIPTGRECHIISESECKGSGPCPKS